KAFGIFDAHTGERRLQLGDAVRGYIAAAFSPDGKIVALARIDHAVLYDTGDGRELVRLPAWPEHSLANVLFSPDSRTLVTVNSGPGYGAGTAVPCCLWDVSSSRKRAELRPLPHFAAVGCRRATFSPDGRRVVTAAGDRAQVWVTETGRQLRVLGQHKGVVNL